MKINLIMIDKKGKDQIYAPLVEHFRKMTKTFAEVTVIELFNKEISRAQEGSPLVAKKSYTRAFEKYLTGAYTIALDPSSKEVDSFEFAELLKDKRVINFFIGGAHGLETSFLTQCDAAISLGKITLSHKLVKVVLMEQLFRGLAINHNHPYHK
ncbi:MAG TPA: 23S rRNA (pseudouridine(1915)-N(3))-methyltransferase RlmH [Epsilonproteobacteria bacterium]|nr:23S rRNA (pseudouridine(1915)-N(3))-methyltransferase RlmH [Campylobacterota bacterium]